MSAAKHTPGPWRVVSGGLDGWDIHHEAPGAIKVVCGTGGRGDCGAIDDKADAHAISAVPEMLAALEELQHFARKYRNGIMTCDFVLDRIGGAIAKATGSAA